MGREEVDQCESCLQEAYARERHRCEAEMQKLRRIVSILCEQLALFYKDSDTTPEYWLREAEKDVARELSP